MELIPIIVSLVALYADDLILLGLLVVSVTIGVSTVNIVVDLIKNRIH